MIGLLTLLSSSGCAPAQEVIHLEIRRSPPMLKKWLPVAETHRIAVIPFEDQRADTTRIGTRRDWLGNETPLTVGENLFGDMIAEVLVDYLKNREGWKAWIVKPGVVSPKGGSDLTVSGTVVAFEAKADPGFARTLLTVTSQIQMTALSPVDQHPVVATIADQETRWVFWYEPADLEGLTNALLRKMMEQFVAQVSVDGRGLK